MNETKKYFVWFGLIFCGSIGVFVGLYSFIVVVIGVLSFVMRKNKQVLYFENQYFSILIVLLLLASLTLIILNVLNIGTKPIPTLYGIFIQLFFWLIIVLFYRLSMTITKDYIFLKFGIGLIKKRIKIPDIDRNKIERYYIPWYYGMGIRLLKNGVIFNTSFGKSIKLIVKNKTLIIGTKNYSEIKKIITEL